MWKPHSTATLLWLCLLQESAVACSAVQCEAAVVAFSARLLLLLLLDCYCFAQPQPHPPHSFNPTAIGLAAQLQAKHCTQVGLTQH